jgi:serine/threonine-protein kinase
VTTRDERWQRINALLEQALAKPPDEREAWLDEACGDDEALKREVIELLSFDREQTGELRGAIGSAAASLVSGEADSLLGEQVGSYRIIEKIADGGMGSVYLAERADEEFEQRVAIKMVHFATASPALIERFQLERQILATLEHPNIARLLDGGRTEAGIPYLAMEYVDGRSIFDYARDEIPSVADRLQLFLRICDAVQYAHRNTQARNSCWATP